MKKRILPMMALVALLFTMSAHTAGARVISARPILSFDGTTAVCYADCKGGNMNDEVEATLTLYHGSSYVDSWSDSGKGRVSFSGECKVKSGEIYRLVLRYSVNGVSKPSISTTNKCP